MSDTKKFVIRCRAIILHEGKLLAVRHNPATRYVALPGGHLEWGEDIESCMKREIIEELGIEPTMGRLLYVNTYLDGVSVQSVEFFFEITNGKDYVNYDKNARTHAHELSEIVWIAPTDDIQLMPDRVCVDFKNSSIFTDFPKYISNLK